MWDKLTVGQFITLYDIEGSEQLNIVEKQQKMLSIIEGKPETDYDAIKYRELVEQCATKLAFFNSVPDCKPVDYLTINDNRYKFCFELTEITAGQYIDITHFSGQIMQLNKIAACFFLPMKGDRYMEYGTISHEVVAEDILNARFIDVYGCMLFFYQLFKELISDTITFSNMKEETKQALLRLWQDGDGYFQLKK
jgi:hypothetical protein